MPVSMTELKKQKNGNSPQNMVTR